MINFEQLVKELEGKTSAQLRNLYSDALMAEAEAKKELYILRQRVANLATDADAEEEKLITDAKARVSEAGVWLKALEAKLFGNDPNAPKTV
jgi:hypothetical protein